MATGTEEYKVKLKGDSSDLERALGRASGIVTG